MDGDKIVDSVMMSWTGVICHDQCHMTSWYDFHQQPFHVIVFFTAY